MTVDFTVIFLWEERKMQKKAAIYIRVSTDAQFEEGYSIDAQKEQLSAYCVSKGIKNYEFYIDGGWSGSNIERPEMQRLIHDAKNGKLSHCIVYKLDRLSRSQKDTLYVIEDVLNPNGVDFVSLTETLDTGTPMGRLMIGILSAFAQLERENIRMRTRMGMKERVKSGLWMGGGRIPFGYDYDREQGVLVPNADAEKVRKVFSLYIQGEGLQAIADMLGLCNDMLVRNILSRKTYYGIIEYNGEEYQGQHEPVISKETYDMARQCMAERSSVRKTNYPYFLSGLLYCGKCGARMRYQKWGNKYHKIMCYSQQTSKKNMIKDPNCDQPKLMAKEVEEAVLVFLFSHKEDLMETDHSSNVFQRENTLDILEREADELRHKIKRLYSLYAGSENEILRETIEDEEKKYEKVQKKIRSEKQKQENDVLKELRMETIEKLKDTWDYMADEEKKNAIRLLIRRITITDQNIEVNLNI